MNLSLEEKQRKYLNSYLSKKHMILNWVLIIFLFANLGIIVYGIIHEWDPSDLVFFITMATSTLVRLGAESESLGKAVSKILLELNNIKEQEDITDEKQDN